MNSDISCTAASAPLTPPTNSGFSNLADSTAFTLPLNSGTSWIVASPFTPPVNSGNSCTAASAPLTPLLNSGFSSLADSTAFTLPLNSGTSCTVASPFEVSSGIYSRISCTVASAPLTPPVNSGTSCIAPSVPFTAPVNSGFSSAVAASSPFTPPLNSGSSAVAASTPLTPPVNSGTSLTAASLPLVAPGIPAPSRLTGRLCMLSIAPEASPVISWPRSDLSIVNSKVFVSYWVMKFTFLPFANWSVGILLTKTSESNSTARIPGHFSITFLTLASLGEILSFVKKSQLNFLKDRV